MARAIVAIVGLGVVAMLTLGGIQVGLENAGYEQTVVNETFTPADAGNVTTLNESNRVGAYYDRNVTVYDENDTQMAHGTDYEWIQDNGTLIPLSGGDLAGDNNGTITYSYEQTTSEQRSLATLMAQFPRALALMLPLLGLILMLVLVTG